MLESLLSFNTADQVADFGKELLEEKSLLELESDLVSKHIAFSSDDYLTADTLSKYMRTDSDIRRLLDLDRDKMEDVKILHRMQLVQKRCPAIANAISAMLRRMTF